MHIDIHLVNSDKVSSTGFSNIPMPVHLAYDRRTLIEKELDNFVDAKGCRQSAYQTIHRLEPVCCCERCYACLSNPLIEKLCTDTDQSWSSEDIFIAEDEDVDWFSSCQCPPCDCKRCLDVCRKLCHNGGQSEVIPADDSPPINKKRMTANSLNLDGIQQCPTHTGRRPLTDLQRDTLAIEGSGMKRPELYYTTNGSWSHDTYTHLCDNTRSWVQPPPNRTICHIVDDVTLDRLTSSSPVLTRCCLASRKQGTSRHVGKGKMKGQAISR